MKLIRVSNVVGREVVAQDGRSKAIHAEELMSDPVEMDLDEFRELMLKVHPNFKISRSGLLTAVKQMDWDVCIVGVDDAFDKNSSHVWLMPRSALRYEQMDEEPVPVNGTLSTGRPTAATH